MRKRTFHRLLLLVMMAGVLSPTAAQADTYSPPYTVGKQCVHHFWGSTTSYRAYCNVFPTFPRNGGNVNELSAIVTRAPAAGSWYGYPTVGGKERVSGQPFPTSSWVADVVSDRSIMEFTSPAYDTTITATANTSEMYSIASPYYFGLKLCLSITDYGPPSGMPQFFGPIGGSVNVDCIYPNLVVGPIRTLSVTAVVPANRRFGVDVELYNANNDGAATIDVYQVSCTGVCLPRTPNPAYDQGGGGGGGGY
ncbi:MAG: hypothetical protein ABIS18_08925 [Actinomycetota bacterium]